MGIFDGIWGSILLIGIVYFVGAGWARLDRTHPRLSMALNIILGLAVLASIVMVIVSMFPAVPR